MKKHYIHSTLILIFVLFLTGCSTKIDNWDYPSSVVSGQFLYNGQPVPIMSTSSDATGSNTLQLHQVGNWDVGYIKMFAKEDGTYAINTFDGDYYLVVQPGRGPWVPVTDTLRFVLNGEQKNVNFNVTPYFWISGFSTTYQDSVFTASFNLEKVVSAAVLEKVVIYLSTTSMVDNVSKTCEKSFTSLVPGSNVISVDLKTLNNTDKTRLKKTGFLYARVGVKTQNVSDLMYSSTIKLW